MVNYVEVQAVARVLNMLVVRLNFRVARLKPEPELLVVDVLVAPTLA